MKRASSKTAGRKAAVVQTRVARNEAAIARVRVLLRRQSTLVLATAGKDGLPHSTPLFFFSDGEMRLYWFSSPKSLHSRNCKRNPAASVTVFRSTRQWQKIQGVQMRGTVSMVSGRGQRSIIAQQYCDQFGLDDRFHAVLRRSSLCCFTPGWLRLIDNSREFGEKVEFTFQSE